jgi:xylose isomerase
MLPKFGAGLWMFGGSSDRFNVAGYKPGNRLEEQIEMAARVPGLKAVEVHQSDLGDMTPTEFARLLSKKRLICSCVNTNVWGEAKYMHGGFTHRNPRIRRQAIGEAKKAVDIARAINSPSIGLWLGSDGFDYPFQCDYTVHWDLLVSAIREVAKYAGPRIKVGLEYKLKEPRTHMTIGDVGKALLICAELGMKNVGVTVDLGHALMSRENPGESVALLGRSKKLFNVHINDAYREWDDDMVPGTVHVWETLEFLYWCQQTKYDGWISLDMYPYREDSAAAADMAIRNLVSMWKMVNKINVPALKKAQQNMGALETQEVVRKLIFQ